MYLKIKKGFQYFFESPFSIYIRKFLYVWYKKNLKNNISLKTKNFFERKKKHRLR